MTSASKPTPQPASTMTATIAWLWRKLRELNRMKNPRPFTEIHVKYLVAGEGLEEKYVKEAVNDTTTKYCSVATTINERAKITFSYEVSRA